MFTEKQKVVIVGLGLIAVNATAFAILALWPTASNDKSQPRVEDAYGAETPPTTLEGALNTTTTSVVKDVSVVASPLLATSSDFDVLNHKIEHTSSEVDKCVVPVYTEGTVFEAMEAYRDASGTFTFSGKTFPGLGFFVEAIDGRKSEGGEYWILYINGDTSSVGVSHAAVVPGDVVEWKFEPSIY